MRPSWVVVTHNIVSHANEIARSQGQGGIAIGCADHVLVEGNVVHDSVSNGIKVTNPNGTILVRDNHVTHITDPGNTAYD